MGRTRRYFTEVIVGTALEDNVRASKLQDRNKQFRDGAEVGVANSYFLALDAHGCSGAGAADQKSDIATVADRSTKIGSHNLFYGTLPTTPHLGSGFSLTRVLCETHLIRLGKLIGKPFPFSHYGVRQMPR